MFDGKQQVVRDIYDALLAVSHTPSSLTCDINHPFEVST